MFHAWKGYRLSTSDGIDRHSLTLYFLNAFCITWAEWNSCCCSDSTQKIATVIIGSYIHSTAMYGNIIPESTRCEKSWCLTFGDSLSNSQSSTTDGDSFSKNSWVDTVDLLDTDAILGEEGTEELVLYCSKSILNWLGSNWVIGECICTPSGISGRTTPGLMLLWLHGELVNPPLPLWIGLPIWLVSNREGEEDPWSLAVSRLVRFGSDKWWWWDDESDAPYIVGGTRKLSNNRGSLLMLVFDIFLWTWACADIPSGYELIEGSGWAQNSSNGPGKCSVLSYKVAPWLGSDWWAKLKLWFEMLPELEWNPSRPSKLKTEPCKGDKWADCMAWMDCTCAAELVFDWWGSSDDWERNSQRSWGKSTAVNSELSSTSIAWGWWWLWGTASDSATTVVVDSEDVDGRIPSPNAPRGERRHTDTKLHNKMVW